MNINFGRSIIALLALALTSITYAQDIKPLPSDLGQLPTLGVEKADSVKYLEKVLKFSEEVEKNGLTRISGMTPDGKFLISFKLVNTKVIAGLIEVPDSTHKEDSALKFALLIRFMKNLVPEVDWDNPQNSQSLGEAVAKITLNPEAAIGRKIGEKSISVLRNPETGLIKFGVMNTLLLEDRYNIGSF